MSDLARTIATEAARRGLTPSAYLRHIIADYRARVSVGGWALSA